MAIEQPEILPWHRDCWADLVGKIDMLPHAMILAGDSGTGRVNFAVCLAAALLCSATEGRPCGCCTNCNFFSASTHPDLHVISSEAACATTSELIRNYGRRYLDQEPGKTTRKNLRGSISIAQSRAMVEAVNQRPHIASAKAFVIFPAEKLTLGAANALLKILEEPPPSTFFVLVGSTQSNLLPTISSRCQNYPLTAPADEQAAKWLVEQGVAPQDIEVALSLHRGKPFLALEYARSGNSSNVSQLIEGVFKLLAQRNRSVVATAAMALKFGESESLLRLQQFAYDLIRLNLNPASKRHMNFASFSEDILQLAERVDVRKMMDASDRIGMMRMQLAAGSIDKSLAMEDALIRLKSALHEV